MKIRFFGVMVPLFIATSLAFGQKSVAEIEIMKPIEGVFKGMATGDSTLIRQQFEKEITMATVFKNKEGKTILHRENSLDDFLTAVAGKHEAYNEPIWNITIQVDGDLALVSCDYAFYLGKTFSHCGVDAFQLVKRENGWKIFHLVDTRKKEGCNVPDEVQAKFK